MRSHCDFNDGTDREKRAHSRHVSVDGVQNETGVKFPFHVAAPSFVIPAGAAENSRFLADFFPEVCLLFFETEACLRYTEEDLPADLTNLPISWHVHLPLDLPWASGLDTVWKKLTGLMDKAAYLKPKAWVLHPPTEPDMLLPLAAHLRDAGIDPADVLLENVDESDLCAVWDEARSGGYSTCLDLGHIIAYGQHSVLDLPDLWDTVRMLHVYAPINGGRHTGLGHLNETGKALLRQMLTEFRGDTVTLEVFDETEIFHSLSLLAQWAADWRNAK
ncbi:cobamide remodeling phosphodiesterase CbiR [uncultured Pseudodesulfovibrio sp.]|uniref:cobamide remodeling phosphodiesterase CbiR n=1 Tax=uncultured Pseudodesulfovibrio sp. TaxID=2035858 RepID=UPI0029C73CC2|nr:cobamide remodeling phosphodiesterase CbiR [uncultured Pseudodesulfovibrio sp.]